MCIEIYTRYRRCSHTCALRWDYCAILTPRQRQPPTGRSCRRYKLRYKETSDNSDCFECRLTEVAGWSALGAPTFGNLPERSPTMSSFFGGGTGRGNDGPRSPPFSPSFMERSPTFSTFGGAVGGSDGKRDRESKDSEVSVVASDEPVSPVAKDWWGSGDSKDSQGKQEDVEDVKRGGLRGWFKRNFKPREGIDGAWDFRTVDA